MLRLFLLLAAATLLAATAPGRASAQTPAPARAATPDELGRLRRGTLLRVNTSQAGWVEGPLLRVSGEALVVGAADGERSLPLAGVRSVWARRRETSRGAKIGALVGGAGGLAFSAFTAALLAAEDEGGQEDVIGVLAGGTALSIAGGALVGGITGAALPRWDRVWGTGNAPPPVVEGGETTTAPGAPGRFASAEMSLGFARTGQDGGTEGGLSRRVALMGEFDLAPPERATRPFVAVGLEGEVHELGTTPPRPMRISTYTGGQTRFDTVMVRRSYQVRDVGGLVRAGVERGGVQPYALLGLGADQRGITLRGEDGDGTESRRYVAGYAAGAGLQLRPARRRLSAGVEGRWHSNLFPGQSDGVDEAFGFWTVAATLNLRW